MTEQWSTSKLSKDTFPYNSFYNNRLLLSIKMVDIILNIVKVKTNHNFWLTSKSNTKWTIGTLH